MFDLVSFIPRAVAQGIPLLLGSTGETITEKSGNLNLGIPGVMYVGAISGVIGSFMYEQSVEKVSPFPAIMIPLLYKTIGREKLYPIIAKGEYDAAEKYKGIIADFPEVETVMNDETHHGDAVLSLLE